MKWNRTPYRLESARERRIRITEKINGMQIMPRLAAVNYWCMLGATAVAVLLEAVLHFRFSTERGFLFLLDKAVYSAFLCWTFFAVILVTAGLIQLQRLKNGHVETKYVERDLGDDRDPFVPVLDPRPKYIRYIRTAAAGEIILVLLLLLCRLF
jgi:hypothetical protein